MVFPYYIPVELPRIFPGALLIFSGAPGNIQGNLTGMILDKQWHRETNINHDLTDKFMLSIMAREFSTTESLTHRYWLKCPWDPRNKRHWNLKQNTKLYFEEDDFENIMSATCRPFCSGLELSSARADSRFAPSQWETALLCNDVSHWLGGSLESAPSTEGPEASTACLIPSSRSARLPWRLCELVAVAGAWPARTWAVCWWPLGLPR